MEKENRPILITNMKENMLNTFYHGNYINVMKFKRKNWYVLVVSIV